jgi:hypothetical protein
MGTLHKCLSIFIIPRSYLFRMRNVVDKICGDNQNAHFTRIFNLPPTPDNRAVYEIMRTSTEDPDKSQMTIWRMRIACWKPKTTNTHSKYVVLTALLLKMVARKRLNVTLHLHCLPFLHSAFAMSRISQ